MTSLKLRFLKMIVILEYLFCATSLSVGALRRIYADYPGVHQYEMGNDH